MNHTVVKLWGAEEWLVNNDLYCAKRLYIRPGFMCSLHYHNVKDETFYVEHGLVRIETYSLKNGRLWAPIDMGFIGPGSSLRISPGTPHRFRSALPDGAATILEVSTHHDDADVVRIEESQACTFTSTTDSTST